MAALAHRREHVPGSILSGADVPPLANVADGEVGQRTGVNGAQPASGRSGSIGQAGRGDRLLHGFLAVRGGQTAELNLGVGLDDGQRSFRGYRGPPDTGSQS